MTTASQSLDQVRGIQNWWLVTNDHGVENFIAESDKGRRGSDHFFEHDLRSTICSKGLSQPVAVAVVRGNIEHLHPWRERAIQSAVLRRCFRFCGGCRHIASPSVFGRDIGAWTVGRLCRSVKRQGLLARNWEPSASVDSYFSFRCTQSMPAMSATQASGSAFLAGRGLVRRVCRRARWLARVLVASNPFVRPPPAAMPMSLTKCSTKNPGSKFPAMMRGPKFESDQLPAAPEATDCMTLSRSRPAR